MGWRDIPSGSNELTGILDSILSRTDAVERVHDVPTGSVLDVPLSAVLPPGFLWADGHDVRRLDYPGLFGVYGETFGPGDGFSTFTLPRMGSDVDVGRSRWSNVAFAGYNVNYGSGFEAVQFRKDAFGMVHLRGLTACYPPGVTNPMTLFQLPIGFRPDYWEIFPIQGSSAAPSNVQHRLDVYSDGTVQIQNGPYAYDGQYLSLGGVTFEAGVSAPFKIIRY